MRTERTTRSGSRRRPLWPLAVCLVLLPGCGGEAAVLVAIALGASLGAWFVGSDRQQRALYAASRLRRAIETGKQRDIEFQLRRQLALAEAGEAVSPERQWLARAQLGGLLVAEWRLDEARGVYGGQQKDGLAPHLRHLANYGEHELHLLEHQPDDDDLAAIRRDRDACLAQVPGRYRETVARAWGALEGLALSRMGRSREAARALEASLPSLDFNPARVVYLFHLGQAYEHIGERELAAKTYAEAASAFPGTRLASEAKARTLALGDGHAGDGMFRGMLPEAPQASPSSALVPVTEGGDDPERA